MYILKISFTILIIFTTINTHSQSIASSQFVERVSYRMRDSLNLSKTQFKEIYGINQNLEAQKDSVWKKYHNVEFVNQGLQSVENTRDSLYHTVLTNQQFNLYLKKKILLINNR